MSHSPVFVASGGGFSSLVADCAEHLGGVSLRPSISSEGLEESCWLAPKPIPAIDKNYSYSWLNLGNGWHGKDRWTGTVNYPPEETIWQ